MSKSLLYRYIIAIFSLFLISVGFTNCLKTENPVLFKSGMFPDTVMNLVDINSEYDDYNMSVYQLTGNSQLVFSSNRKSSGGQFDLEQAILSFIFDQNNGSFGLGAGMTDDAFLDKLINKAKTGGNDFGPYRLYSSLDGYEYFVLSSVNAAGNLDLYYLKNRPVYNNSSMPEIDGPYPVKLLNSGFDDAYLCFDVNLDSAYYISNKNGNFDIYLQKRPTETNIADWFNQNYAVSAKVDSINSSSDDKCPMISRKIMVFTSNRPGGMGGYDLYYSVFRKGNWSSPVNMGSRINSEYDEYRPVLGYHPDFTNSFLMFSSNRPAGIGGFDLYFSGYEFPAK
jgi:hypothetical protein